MLEMLMGYKNVRQGRIGQEEEIICGRSLDAT